MIQLKSKYNGEHKSIYVIYVGDLHLGNRYYNPKYLEMVFKFIEKNRNRCRLVLMGDIFEVATKTSVGRSVYDEVYPTQKQFEKGLELFKPYADIIDCVVEGNHEERIIRDTSFEIVENFCHRLGVPEAHGRFQSILNIGLGSGITYSLFNWHGASGGVTEAAAMNSLLKLPLLAIAHVYAMGHTHKLFSFQRKVALPQPNEATHKEMPLLFVNTGTALDSGGYGEQKGFPLNKIGFGAVQLFADERKATFHNIEDLI